VARPQGKWILTIKGLENSLAFINFNYDDVLEKNFLNFSNLPSKYIRYNHRPRLEDLSRVKVNALFPHGKFSETQGQGYYITIHKQTMKSHQTEHLDVVSCYESNKHQIIYSDFSHSSFELYLMGLGGGMKVNLDNIEFPYNSISSVHVTIKNPANKVGVVKYLSEKYNTTLIKTYQSCDELVKKAF
jgi:hypothetical protein